MSYERSNLAAWVGRNQTDPATGKRLTMESAFPNVALRCAAWPAEPVGCGGRPALYLNSNAWVVL